jgi:hypothetical protein
MIHAKDNYSWKKPTTFRKVVIIRKTSLLSKILAQVKKYQIIRLALERNKINVQVAPTKKMQTIT